MLVSEAHARRADRIATDYPYPMLRSGPDKRVPPRGGSEWIRRGTLVVPVEPGWIILRGAADLTSRSLRMDVIN
jgi:hypothetical protein